MKKVLFLTATLFLFISALSAQNIKANIPDGADPAAVSINFPPVDALALPNGDIQMGVAVKATVRNIGSKPYLPGAPMLQSSLFMKKGGGPWVEVDTKSVGILGAGSSVYLDHYTTYILGKEKAPTFKLVVNSKNAGVANPDVNMNNNQKVDKP